jgi:hypothetical protein
LFFLGRVERATPEFGFDFGDSDAEALLNFCDACTVAEVARFVEVLEIGPEFHEQFLRRPKTHVQEIVAQNSGPRQRDAHAVQGSSPESPK